MHPTPLNPGSRPAIAAGCTCPVLDNGHGRGFRGIAGMFVYNEWCPIHGGDGAKQNRELDDESEEHGDDALCPR